jgi:hypothetical protein
MSPPIGDSFPKEFKDEFSSSVLKAGSVIRCLVGDIKNPKIKRFIVVGVSFDKVALGAVYINTEVNQNVFYSAELQELHVPLVANQRDYLDHDSHVDCSRIYEKSFQEIKDIVTNDPSSYIGELNDEDFKIVRDKLKSSKTITPATKKKFGTFL